MDFLLFSPLKTIRGCGKMLLINIILMFRGKINELKAENGLKWNMWVWLSAFYYFYFISKTVVLKVGAQNLGEVKRNSVAICLPVI